MDAYDDRAARLIGEFARAFGRRPTVIVRAPGRVNLIGEHTDYNGLPVLPMAIGRDVLVAAAPGLDRVVGLRNVAPGFPDRAYELAATIPPYPAGDWGNYHKAAAQGLIGELGDALSGGDFLVDGNVPVGAGLSSSAALVVGSALALLAVSGLAMPRLELAELTARAERYVGTLSGGMDQAVCLLGERGCALRIDFDPLCARTVPVSAGCSFVVLHSLVSAEKAGGAREAYNRRVVECRLACEVLSWRLRGDSPGPLPHFGALRRSFPGRRLVELLPALESVLPDAPVPLADVATILALSPQALAARVGLAAQAADPFSVLARARHVLGEADRVEAAERALRAGDWAELGELMDASHASCRDDYEISCPELEELVACAKRAGALGARLTGAGFGGCTVNLVQDAAVAPFLARVDQDFYRRRDAGGSGEHRFVFKPEAGASVTRL